MEIPERNREALLALGQFPYRAEENMGDELRLSVFQGRNNEPLNDDTNIFGVICTIARELDEEFQHGPANSGEIIFRVKFEPR